MNKTFDEVSGLLKKGLVMETFNPSRLSDTESYFLFKVTNCNFKFKLDFQHDMSEENECNLQIFNGANKIASHFGKIEDIVESIQKL